ncbi:hypothetical protein KIW84_062726 [Lathyrus oleraceus]|uniref:Uncharacterized protein n=1 Tax=Pisum sativum TaxID=3888 RepID=A0A9D4W5T5_PEA|nr:hypothetical protein KIW84_062726 [Pisum sativum]
MAPPKVLGASKKQKMGGSTSRHPRSFDSNCFKGVEQDERYKEFEKIKIWSEKQFNINREGTYREVAHISHVNIPFQVHGTLSGFINDLYAARYCMPKKKKAAA